MYQLEETVRLEVRLENETVWLSIDEMSQLFGRDISVIGKHIRNLFKEKELTKEAVWANFAHTASDGKSYQVDYYNLDVIISVGYHIGASLKDLGKKMFAFSKLDIPAKVITDLL